MPPKPRPGAADSSAVRSGRTVGMPLARHPASRTSPDLPGGARPRPIGLDSSPLHGELLGVERLEERARALAAEFTLARDPRRGPPRLLRSEEHTSEFQSHSFISYAVFC